MAWHTALAVCTLFSLTLAKASTTNRIVPGGHTPPPSTKTTSHRGGALATHSTAPGFCRGDDSICCAPDGSRTVTVASELDAFVNCQTFTGSLTLKDFTTSSIVIPVATFTNGGLELSGANNHGAPVVVDTSRLNTVHGDIIFSNISALQMPSFPVLEETKSFVFQDVHFVGATEGYSFSINNAQDLQSVQNLTFQRTNINDIGPFPESQNGGPLSLYVEENTQCATVNLPDITRTDDVIVTNNPALAALALTGVGEMNARVVISDNGRLRNLSLPALNTVITTMTVSHNNELTNINLGILTGVVGGVYLEGPIDNLTLSENFGETPSLHGIHVDVTGSGTFQCGKINALEQVHCHSSSGSSSAPTASSSTNPTATSSPGSGHSHGNSGLSSAATIGVGVGVGIGGALVLALGILFCWRSRRKSSPAPRGSSNEQLGKNEYYGYREVPYESGLAAKAPRVQARNVTQPSTSMVGMSDSWVPPDPAAATTEGRSELEEQQGARHEMDARSIDFSDEDEEAETRSLEDIERVHRER